VVGEGEQESNNVAQLNRNDNATWPNRDKGWVRRNRAAREEELLPRVFSLRPFFPVADDACVNSPN